MTIGLIFFNTILRFIGDASIKDWRQLGMFCGLANNKGWDAAPIVF